MGRRSRKRAGSPPHERAAGAAEPREPAAAPGAPPAPPPARRAGHRARLAEAPQPPWAPVPLTEVAILIGLILLLLGAIQGGTARLVAGMTLVTAATAELAWREHLAGYRSHTALLAGVAAMAVTVPLIVLVPGVIKAVVLIVGAIVWLLAFRVLRDLFRRRSGGLSWRT